MTMIIIIATSLNLFLKTIWLLEEEAATSWTLQFGGQFILANTSSADTLQPNFLPTFSLLLFYSLSLSLLPLLSSEQHPPLGLNVPAAPAAADTITISLQSNKARQSLPVLLRSPWRTERASSWLPVRALFFASSSSSWTADWDWDCVCSQVSAEEL